MARTVKARDLEVGMVFVFSPDEEEESGISRDEIVSLSKGNGIVRFVSKHGDGYFDENSKVDVEN